MIKIIFGLLILFSCSQVPVKTDFKSFSQKYEESKSAALISVKGMVCPMCEKALEKEFSQKSEVSFVKASFENNEVLLIFKDGKSLSAAEIKKTISDHGYRYEGLKAK